MYVLFTWWGCAGEPTPAPVAPPVVTEPPKPAGPRVVFLGDSLTAGLGLSEREAFPARVGERLAASGAPIEVVNAGVSGDTTAGGLRRIPWILSQHPAVVVVGLGANDTLRGLPPAETAENVRGIVQACRAAGSEVVLLGVRANPTLGPDYAAAFDAIWPTIAREQGLPLVPFVLEGFADAPSLLQADGLHPTAEGHDRIAALVLPALEPVVRALPPR